ncbi:Sulfotransferase family protein [Blastococcus sp. DSM 46786]|uniref:sulfotransferase family protein n=1 Tax=Blastococcus sp. DSM 46786 TaxID=1798227 RepID=UPI0008CF5B13|nr:sulfotransferase [Blastococcus sp. DSM 46786]SEK38117.1 Sulfotransferase family protein [Blastococcus sp. DSM 46786]
MARIKVLSIVGPGRSGTTVLAGILGAVDGVVDVGELRWLWQRGLLERRTCGCGLPVGECPLWSAVVAEVAAGRTGTVAALAGEIASAQALLTSRRRRLRVVRSAATGADWRPLEPIRTVTGQLVRAVAEVTGARVIVDSSKRAQDAAVLAGLPDVDLYVLHMVRDPRAVVFSWGRRDKTIRVDGGSRPMGTRGLLSSVSRWMENGLGAAALRRHVPADRWMFVRYEEFAAQPRVTVSRILTFLGEDAAAPFVDDDSVVLDVNHTVAGNPNRFRVGPVTIRLDDEWSRRMPRHRQLLVQGLTWPLRRTLPGGTSRPA